MTFNDRSKRRWEDQATPSTIGGIELGHSNSWSGALAGRPSMSHIGKSGCCAPLARTAFEHDFRAFSPHAKNKHGL